MFPRSLPVTNSSTKPDPQKRWVEILVRGIVQGVGFRPFVFQLASRLGIRGSVTNTSDGVVIKAHASDSVLLRFLDDLVGQAPPLARIVSIEKREPAETPVDTESFQINASEATATVQAIIPPDVALCDDCLRELHDSQDRRYRYPFINCTNCGPRFSIIETLPYDRPRTSMKVFSMCRPCTTEYGDPTNRRYHAQPNACSRCGPRISWHNAQGERIAVADVVRAAIDAINDDAILAIRGLGGFHLCVNACSETAVALLRARKNRPAKPLAVMVRGSDDAARLCYLTDEESAILVTPEHPIVLLRPRPGHPLAESVAPALSDIGIMLPYTPLHHLLFSEPDCPVALVMTSGNAAGEPICTGNNEALQRLKGIADFFLLHDRPIVTRVDDSVVKVIAHQPRLMRRSRGYVPIPVYVPYELPPILGCGGGLKSTFSLGRGHTIFPSQHIGDLFNLASYDFYQESIDNLKRLFALDPQVVACDLHPDYLSTRYAEECGLPLYHIQHHHAHAAAVMAEHGLRGPVLAVVLDGTGYGPDGTIWGGELLQADCVSYHRLGSLQPMHLPGGDAASSEPWRMALSALYATLGPDAESSPLMDGIDQERRRIVMQMLTSGFNSPLTSSCGRLFDAVTALLGLQFVSSFEGEAAMRLEACARTAFSGNWDDELDANAEPAGDIRFLEKDRRWEIISSEFVKRVVHTYKFGTDRPVVALQFHSWLISRISHLVEKISGTSGIKEIVLSGGCLQNGLLLEGLLFSLSGRGLSVYTGSAIPNNDGGISVGQAVIGGLQHVSCGTHESRTG